ncbi:AIE_G0016600.mRNA.1.CDS.1 [Saccharomyces cerevisiae]|nr:AIE_G0016600.mRNA.1.CDS.1 [Saccharomyces cerevisiae]CAI6638720.1 AIE_G0016600.mRNA.1.CDS.1 [Saccharomyces cerevisiae]
MSGRQIKELYYYKVWSNLRESKTEVLQYFLNWDEKKCQEEWEAKTIRSLGSARESWSFSAFAFHDERWTGVRKTEYLLEQISEVWLLPHWVDLANVEVLAADNTRVALYMLMVAVHKELIAMMFQTVDLIYYYVEIRAREVGE